MTTIHVPILARIEGEGALELTIRDQHIISLSLKIYEPPRLFEKFLEGRHYSELLDIVARICGICPVAYQMSAVHALEQCFGVLINPWVRMMRRLFYCGEWLESHSMHIHFLALPDFLGFPSALEMAKVYPIQLQQGLMLQALGNEVISFLGGRSVHPVGACVGGFYKAPSLIAAKKLLEKIKKSLFLAEALIHFTARLPLANNSHDFCSVALSHPTEYPFNEGSIKTTSDLSLDIKQFDQYFSEYQVAYSNALHCTLQGKNYLVGPLACININHQQLPEETRKLMKDLDLTFPSFNMFDSIIARALEIHFCLLEAIRILEGYFYPECAKVEVTPRAGIGYGCSEAPRGLLWHAYQLDENGMIQSARLVPPTSPRTTG